VKAVENSLLQTGISLASANILIIGSTGDIGSACVHYFAGKVARILLNARQPVALEKQAFYLSSIAQESNWSTRLNDLLPQADVVISVASSLIQNCDISLLPAHTVICDAGYPKNLSNLLCGENKLFPGGLGLVKEGFQTLPHHYKNFYRFLVNNIAHGCLLEAVVLAMEKKHIAYSEGRGNITVRAMEEIYALANHHGIETAPQFDSMKSWQTSTQINQYENITTGTGTTF
jgi:predicted amino acid dehydrogenase